MPDKVVETPYPLVDADPHFSRVVRYMRPSDYAVWAGATAAFPSALYFWGIFSTNYLRLSACKLTTFTLFQRWPIPQGRVCGPLCVLVACLVSSVASYLPTSGRVVSSVLICPPHTEIANA